MARIWIGIGETKTGTLTNLYTGNLRSGAKTAVQTDVNAGTHFKGTMLSNLFPGRQIAAKNPAGT